MTAKEVYKIWAPVGKRWVDWVRPVPFVTIGHYSKSYGVILQPPASIQFLEKQEENQLKTILGINGWEKSYLERTAVIVDMCGGESVSYGVALTDYGFRPIPVYNGTEPQEGVMATVNNNVIEYGLIKGAIELKKITIANDAPPAFLMDSDRMNRYKMDESVFDNSWDIYPQDLPSAKYFLENGIDKIIVVGEKIQSDLKKILYKFQKEGIKISFVKRYEEPKELIIKK